MSLERTSTINVRQPGEGWIQTYGTYAGDLDGDGWSDFIVPNEIAADIRVFMNDQQGSYDDFTIFNITEVQDQALMKDLITTLMDLWILLVAIVKIIR